MASESLSAFGTKEAVEEPSPAVALEGRQLEIGEQPHDFLDIADEVVHHVFPEQLAQRTLRAGASPRDWLYRVYTLSGASRGITEPVATLVVMLAAVKFGLRHQLLLQTEKRLGLAHKALIPNLDLYLEILVSEMVAVDRNDSRFSDWLQRTLADRSLHPCVAG